MTEGVGSRPEKRGGHERSDLSLRTIIIFGAVLTVSAIVIQIILWLLFEGLAARSERADRPRSIFVPADGVPPPRLMVREGEGLPELRAREERVLGSYGWVDREGGIVRIPVEKAIEAVLSRGLPARGGTRPGIAEGEEP